MEIEFINRIIKISLIVAGVIFIVMILLVDFPTALGFLAGTLWGCLNLFLLKHLIQNLLVIGTRSYLKIYTIVGLKFPLLYLVGYGLLRIKELPILSLVMGFSFIFVMIFLKGLGLLLTQKTQS